MPRASGPCPGSQQHRRHALDPSIAPVEVFHSLPGPVCPSAQLWHSYEATAVVPKASSIAAGYKPYRAQHCTAELCHSSAQAQVEQPRQAPCPQPTGSTQKESLASHSNFTIAWWSSVTPTVSKATFAARAIVTSRCLSMSGLCSTSQMFGRSVQGDSC